MDTRRGRRPSLPPLWRRAASAAAVLGILAMPAVAGMVEIAPATPPSAAKVLRPQELPPLTGSQPLPDDRPPSELPPTDRAQRVVALHPGNGVALPILTYHWIRTNPIPGDELGFHLSVTPENFARQMSFLHFAGVHPVTLAEAVAALQTGKPLPSRPVVLTFDDGYGDFASRATPVLQRYGFVATDYVVSGFVGRPAYMTAAQIHQVEAAGMVIGAHTLSHADLARSAPQAAQLQISAGHHQLEQLLGHAVDDFAYPYGSWNPEVEKLVLADGFRDAVTTQGGSWLQLGDRGAWPRLHVDGGDDLAAFAAKALSGTPPATVEQLLQSFAAQQQGAPQPSPTPTHRIADAAGTDSRRTA